MLKRKTNEIIQSLFHSVNSDLVLAFLLFVFTFAVYQPAWNGQPIWDDDGHITKPELRSIDGLARIWTKPGATQQYYPLTHSVFWLEYHLWGDSPLGYHLVNILLHFISALLLVCLLRRLSIPGAWFVAAIFALHPVQVESVAWISELKNTLSGVFFFASTLIYLQFDIKRKRKLYTIAICFFILGLMSKSVIAMLPVSLLILFWWKRGKLDWKKDIIPLLPFFIIGISSGLFTAWVERKFIGAEGSVFTLTIIERCLIAGRTIWFYVGKIIYPVNLIFVYPRWNINFSVWWQYLFPVATITLTIVLWSIRKRSRALLASFLFFEAMLFPVMGFFNVYPFKFSFVADHFQYLALLGPVVLLSTAGIRLVFFKPLSIIILLICCILTWNQSRIYADASILYQTTIQKNPSCWMAYNNYGALLAEKGQTNEAINQYRKSLEINPFNDGAQTNLGSALFKTGQTDEAIKCFKKALQINPNLAETYNNYGHLLYQIGRTDEALSLYMKALEINPNFPGAHNNLAILLDNIGRVDEAIDHYKKALTIYPDVAEVQNNLATLLAKIGRTDEALTHFQKTLKINPLYPEALYGKGLLLARTGHTVEAIALYRKALEMSPQNYEAHCNLGIVLFQTGQTDESIVEFMKALEINPVYAEAHNNIGNALCQMGRIDEGITHFKKALEINPDKISTLKNLAVAFTRKGQLTDAIIILQKALAVAKSSGDEPLTREIAVNLGGLNQLNRSLQKGSQ